MSFGTILRKLRKRKNIRQEELAKALGLTRSAIGMYETDKRSPNYETLEMFADYFNVDMNTLLGFSSFESPTHNTQEASHLVSYRQLDANAKNIVDIYTDYILEKQGELTSAFCQLLPQQESDRLSADEKNLIKKYRQLTADGKERVTAIIDIDLRMADDAAKKEEENFA